MDAAEVVKSLQRLGLCRPEERPQLIPLTGGVSSDIWRVDFADRSICVKRALGRLKVEADWQAPVERNGFEAAWMRFAAGVCPEAVPALLGQDEAAGLLAMAYLPPERYRLWKDQLRAGDARPDIAEAVGGRLARLHAASAGDEALRRSFATDMIFRDIRLEPYLLATARRHPDLASSLRGLAETTARTRLALVHGDISPKNILIGPQGPVFLDAECAWYGDPAFDVAFCLNHLMLKCLWVPGHRSGFFACFDALRTGYLAHMNWEPAAGFEARAAALLPGLLLARIDGKSPVDYITDESTRNRARRTARRLLLDPPSGFDPVRVAWEKELADLPIARISGGQKGRHNGRLIVGGESSG